MITQPTTGRDMTSARNVAASLLIILLDLSVRAGLDKILAVTGEPATIAQWAQLQSILDLVSGVAITGVLQGLTVLTAQLQHPREEGRLLQSALALGLAISIGLSLIATFVTVLIPFQQGLGGLGRDLVLIAMAAGCAMVIPSTANAYWLGKHQQQKMLGLAMVLGMVWLLIAAAAWSGLGLRGMVRVQSVALFLVGVMLWRYLSRKGKSGNSTSDGKVQLRSLMKFVPAGLAIGILSPASMLAIRSLLSSTLTWNDAGIIQALWRSTDWITATCAGVLSLVFLPRFSSLRGTTRFRPEVLRAAWIVLLPAGVLMYLLYSGQRAVLSVLYDSRFVVSDLAVALFIFGSWIRIASWVFLFGLFAMHRTWLIVAGEILSLPLFAFLLWLFGQGMSLERAALLFALSYLVYFAFNVIALTYEPRKSALVLDRVQL
jgi:PST family polysaccharide transporter